MNKYVARVDFLIKAGSEEEANDLLSSIINPALVPFAESEEAAVVDWAHGSSGAEKYQSPVRIDRLEDCPFPHFTAGQRG